MCHQLTSLALDIYTSAVSIKIANYARMTTTTTTATTTRARSKRTTAPVTTSNIVTISKCCRETARAILSWLPQSRTTRPWRQWPSRRPSSHPLSGKLLFTGHSRFANQAEILAPYYISALTIHSDFFNSHQCCMTSS